jgi:hypothetical protein
MDSSGLTQRTTMDLNTNDGTYDIWTIDSSGNATKSGKKGAYKNANISGIVQAKSGYWYAVDSSGNAYLWADLLKGPPKTGTRYVAKDTGYKVTGGSGEYDQSVDITPNTWKIANGVTYVWSDDYEGYIKSTDIIYSPPVGYNQTYAAAMKEGKYKDDMG